MIYGDQVKVIEGFYKGLKGIITDEETRYHMPTQFYYVEMTYLNINTAGTPSSWIRESDLEKVL